MAAIGYWLLVVGVETSDVVTNVISMISLTELDIRQSCNRLDHSKKCERIGWLLISQTSGLGFS